MPDDAPHVTPVWIDYDADAGRILVNTERDRRKEEEDARNDPRIAVSMVDPENPYRMLSVTGAVAEITTEGVRKHIDELTKRCMGEDGYPSPIETERVIIAIEPTHVSHLGRASSEARLAHHPVAAHRGGATTPFSWALRERTF